MPHTHEKAKERADKAMAAAAQHVREGITANDDTGPQVGEAFAPYSHEKAKERADKAMAAVLKK